MYATVTRPTFMGAYHFNGRSCLSDTFAKTRPTYSCTLPHMCIHFCFYRRLVSQRRECFCKTTSFCDKYQIVENII